MTTYKFDTHVHTDETSSCGMVKAAELVRLYKDAGYQGVIITDHYYRGFFDNLGNMDWDQKIDEYLVGYLNALEAGKKLGLTVIPGMEIRFDENYNDYLVYGIDESFLRENRELYKLSLPEFRNLIRGKDVLIYQAHPFRAGIIPADPLYLDGVEVFNGNPRHNSRNNLAYAFAEENKLKILSGSDFHQIDDLARGGIVIPEMISTPKELVQMLSSSITKELIRTD